MSIEEQLLTASIRETIGEALKAVRKLSRLLEACRGFPKDGEEDLEITIAQDSLRWLIDKAYRDCLILAEKLGLPAARADLMALFETHRKNLTALETTIYDVTLHSPALADVQKYFASFETMTQGREVTGLGVLQTILGETGRIIHEAGADPRNEAQAKAPIKKLLGYGFADFLSENPLPKPLKTYRPDMAVPSLMAVIEYKFVDSPDEASKVLGGIYEDMKGYGGHPDWRSFFAVIYMTGPFLTQQKVDAEFRLVKADLSWIPLVVTGPGSRKKASAL